MFPFNPNIPYIKKNGKRTTLGALLGILPDISEELETLDGRLDDAEEDITSIESDVNKIKNNWVIGTSGNTYKLSTADGIKTIEAILTEADAALKAMQIPEDSAICIDQIILPNGDGNTSQVSLDVSNSNLYYTSLSNIILQALKVQASSNTTMSIYSLRLPEHYFSGFTVTTSSGATNLTSYLDRKPADGTTCYIRYTILHKV